MVGWDAEESAVIQHCVPEDEREHLVADVVAAHLARHPLDEQGLAHVPMVRLEWRP